MAWVAFRFGAHMLGLMWRPVPVPVSTAFPGLCHVLVQVSPHTSSPGCSGPSLYICACCACSVLLPVWIRLPMPPQPCARFMCSGCPSPPCDVMPVAAAVCLDACWFPWTCRYRPPISPKFDCAINTGNVWGPARMAAISGADMQVRRHSAYSRDLSGVEKTIVARYLNSLETNAV